MRIVSGRARRFQCVVPLVFPSLAATGIVGTRSAAKRLAPAANTHAALHPSIRASQRFDSEWVAARSAVVEQAGEHDR